MKKLLYVVICLLLMGCANNEKEPVQEITFNFNYNGKYYQVYTPYKAGVGENYFLIDSLNTYDVNEIESGLLDLSSENFAVETHYYQEGQYLKREDLINLLSKDRLNKANSINVGGVRIDPTYITSIFEGNFLDESGKIKGMSLGIVVNRYQVYKDSSGRTTFHTVSEDVAVEHAKKQATALLEHIRRNDALNGVDILVAIYVESAPNSNVSGSYKQYGVASNNKVDWKRINQNKHFLNSSQARGLDIETYNNYQTLENKIKGSLPNLYISAMGDYQSNKLVKAEIRITRSNYRYGQLLYLTNVVSENIIKYFGNVEVTVEFRENNDVKGYILKSKGSQTADIFVY